jgi:hypothetical protein
MAEAAAAVGAGRRWLQDFLRTHHVPYLRVGNRKMFDELALSALKEEMRHREQGGRIHRPEGQRAFLKTDAKSTLKRRWRLFQPDRPRVVLGEQNSSTGLGARVYEDSLPRSED